MTMHVEEVKRVNEFKYLRSTVQEDGGSGREMARMIQAGWGAYKRTPGIMCKKRVPENLTR